MVRVEEAIGEVLLNLYKPTIELVPLKEAVGRVLGEPIQADRDFPPFHRVAMDGIAIDYSQWKNGRREFVIEGTQSAGQPQKRLRHVQHCIEVMTGAMLPEGTDTVIRYENITLHGDKATLSIDVVNKGQFIHHQGQDARQHNILLTPGILLSPAEIALLASVGMLDIPVYSMPRAAIISSGDELVDIHEIPALHQIRKSNTYAIEAAMQHVGWNGTQFHLVDQKDLIVDSLKAITHDYDVLILSGGVSKGKFDFIPEALEAVGVKKIFHQVSQRPGKPFWFGVTAKGQVVFALPGNPVSTYMCFYRFILPWLWKSLHVEHEQSYASLSQDFSFPPDLTYFLQVSVQNKNGLLMATPEAGGGSGDFANLKKVTGFLELPRERQQFKAGEVFPYFPFR